MDAPTLTDYVHIMYTLFDLFVQWRAQVGSPKLGKPFTYTEKTMIIFFAMMQLKRIFKFKAQRRWLEKHRRTAFWLSWVTIPHRTTLSRRYKTVYATVCEFVCFLARYAHDLDTRFSNHHLIEDKSLFKALGPVWHQSDRKFGRIPEKLRNLDTDATWSKSGYHGWVYGYGLHITCNEAAFPALVQVETGAISESKVIDQKADRIINELSPLTLAADNSYTKAMRIRRWAKKGVALLTPAHKWVKGRYATAYHHFIQEPDIAEHLRKRRTSVEPLFDLIAKVLGTTARQKQLPIQGLKNVRTCLALATLTVQIAIIVNSIWDLPLRNISTMLSVFA
jgi:hypothetical protein